MANVLLQTFVSSSDFGIILAGAPLVLEDLLDQFPPLGARGMPLSRVFTSTMSVQSACRHGFISPKRAV